MKSDIASSQPTASSIAPPSALSSDIAVGDIGLSDVGLSEFILSDVVLNHVDLSDVATAPPTLVTTALLDGSTSASAARAEPKEHVEPRSGLRSVGNGASGPLSDVGFSDIDNGVPLLDTVSLIDGTTSAPASHADSKESVKRTDFEGFLGEAKSIDPAPLPGPRSVEDGDRHREGAAFDHDARPASDEASRQKLRNNSSAGVEEFKWSGLPNNNIG